MKGYSNFVMDEDGGILYDFDEKILGKVNGGFDLVGENKVYFIDYVKTFEERRGYFSSILGGLENACTENNANAIYLFVNFENNRRAYEIYKHKGFVDLNSGSQSVAFMIKDLN